MNRMKAVIIWGSLTFLFVGFLTAQQTETRVALVIGNGAYENLPNLSNPANDATDLTSILGSLGFEVISLIDADRLEMEEAILSFASKLSSGNGVGLFYYAGHGVQSRGSNYLLPIEVDIDQEVELRVRAISADLIFEYMSDAGNPLNMIILDACRDNPFEEGTFRTATRGLARVEELPIGSITVYATQPGNVAEDGRGRNGTFTAALLDHIGTPGLDVKDVLDLVGSDVSRMTNNRQRPWINHDFYGQFSFAGIFGEVGNSATVSSDQSGSSSVKLGNVYIVTEPLGATVFIDGEEQGKSPILVKDLSISRAIVIRAEKDNMSVEQTVRLEGDFAQLVLELSVDMGRFVVISEETDIEVFLDGESLGAYGTGLFENIPAGTYTVELIGDGRYGTGSVNITNGDIAQFRIPLIDVGSVNHHIARNATATIRSDGFRRTMSGTGTLDNVPVGSYSVQVSGEGYVTEDAEIIITKGSQTQYQPFRNGTVSIESEPTGARVIYNGTLRGTTPLSIGDIPPGSADVFVEKDGYDSENVKFSITGGRETALTIPLNVRTAPNGFVLVEAGSFIMGSDYDTDEKPKHRVTITYDFFISESEVTFQQYDEFCRDTRRRLPLDNGWGRGGRPVINVDWYRATLYCNWLSEKEGLTPVYSGIGEEIRCDFQANGYRLPTEAEWEYAARGGHRMNDTVYSGSNDAASIAWYREVSGGWTKPTKRKTKNELGIYDMSGNVWEWCWDRYDAYPTEDVNNPTGAATGPARVARGGSWAFSAENSRVANRVRFKPAFSYNDIGFRVVSFVRER